MTPSAEQLAGAVEFNVVALPDEYTMLDNQLFGRDDIAQFVYI